jgi:signal transduction histidine kinase
MHLQTALLRIAQGAMANVIQHAEASAAVITLAVDHDDLRFTISDDGRGFYPDSHTFDGLASKTDSFGLQATRERVDQLGGELTIDSAPGKGTTVTVGLSIKERA